MSPWIEQLAARVRLDSVRPPDDDKRRAAVAVVLHDEAPSPRVLLMKRTERAGDPWSGHISLPGGGYHPTDRDLLATAVRETREELGLELESVRLLGNLAALSPMTSGPHGIEVTPFVFVTRAALEPRPGPEAESAFWLPIELALSGTLDATYTYPGTDRTFPSWRFGDHTIWGLTYRILCETFSAAK